jgi:hypothetical protein
MYVLVANNLHMSPYKQSCWDQKKGNVYTTPTIDSLYPIKRSASILFWAQTLRWNNLTIKGK